MQNAKCKMHWLATASFCILHFSFCITVSHAAPRFVSEYTGISIERDCTMATQGADYAEYQCPGHDGFRVRIVSGEGAASLGIARGRETESILHPDDLAQTIAGVPPFSSPFVSGDTLEWRYRTEGATKTLVAVIFRISDQAWPEKNILFVARAQPDRFCALGFAKTNAAARALADASGANCKMQNAK